MACFRVDYVGRGELSERQQKLGQFLSRLNHIAVGTFNVSDPSLLWRRLTYLPEFNIAVFLVRFLQLCKPMKSNVAHRRIKFKVTRELVPYLPALTVGSLLVATF